MFLLDFCKQIRLYESSRAVTRLTVYRALQVGGVLVFWCLVFAVLWCYVVVVGLFVFVINIASVFVVEVFYEFTCSAR